MDNRHVIKSILLLLLAGISCFARGQEQVHAGSETLGIAVFDVDAKILFAPGELFVEYQLAAKAMRPDLFVTMAAYGDYGPLYIGTEVSYAQGGYEPGASATTREAEAIIMEAIRELLLDKRENDTSSSRYPSIKWVQERNNAEEHFFASRDLAWKAGVAKTVITPEEAIWMAGYAGRERPAEGKIHDLWAKALHLEDARGNQVLLITMDLESIPREISGRIKERLKAETGMEKKQVVLNCSHTHSGPLLKNDYTYVYLMDDRQTVLTDNYTGWFEERIVQLGKEAAQRAEPVKLFSQNGTVRFQVNRRNNKESELTNLTPLQGPNDYSVPVLKVEDEKGNMKAVVFGYACHPTVLSGYEWCGDYPGFAQVELEKLYPGATALFFQGAGADQNPLPRRNVPLAKQYGKELAAAVERVIDEPMRELQPRLAVAYSEIELEFDPVPTEKELREYAKELTGYEKRWAESALATVEGGGSLPTTYPYPVQVWRLGDQTIVSLGGEVLISYAIRLKELLGEDIFVMGYSNDVMAYIPPDEELLKGGYEIISSQRAYGLPAPWKAGLEKVILDKVMTLAFNLNIR